MLLHPYGVLQLFLTLNGQNSVAITLINAKFGVNIVVGSALSLQLQCTHRGLYSSALHFSLPYRRLGGNARGVPLLWLSESPSPLWVCAHAPTQAHVCDSASWRRCVLSECLSSLNRVWVRLDA